MKQRQSQIDRWNPFSTTPFPAKTKAGAKKVTVSSAPTVWYDEKGKHRRQWRNEEDRLVEEANDSDKMVEEEEEEQK